MKLIFNHHRSQQQIISKHYPKKKTNPSINQMIRSRPHCDIVLLLLIIFVNVHHYQLDHTPV